MRSTERFIAFLKHVDVNRQMDELRFRCAKNREELPHFPCTAIHDRTDVDFDTLDHGEVSFREWEHWLAEVIVVESKGVLPVEDRKSFVDTSTHSKNTGQDVIFLEVGSPRFVVEESIGFERLIWVNQEKLVDL